MPLAAMSVMIFTASCSKETIEGSYSRDDTVVVEDKDTTKPGTSHGGNSDSGAEAGPGDNKVDKPNVDGWEDGDSTDITVS